MIYLPRTAFLLNAKISILVRCAEIFADLKKRTLGIKIFRLILIWQKSYANLLLVLFFFGSTARKKSNSLFFNMYIAPK